MSRAILRSTAAILGVSALAYSAPLPLVFEIRDEDRRRHYRPNKKRQWKKTRRASR